MRDFQFPGARRRIDPPPTPRLRRRRALATAFVGAALLALSPALTGVDAEAATKTSNFTVATTVTTGCTFTMGNLTFPNYVRGSGLNDNATSTYGVFCASATAGKPVPITYTINASGGYKMANGANILNYELCWDAACTSLIPNGSGTALLIDRTTYTGNYYGRIFANQTIPTGVYKQVVNVTLTY